ncbi:nucleotide-binding protein [Archaeoglobus neptunius]|uniref:nucleotide-binding protein n=1 Tax=Archaeoglobus neptunius TaxID=2798580 RepID=UPI0019280672|nr:AAA family ATPase [Archaeoglobus neptunius]
MFETIVTASGGSKDGKSTVVMNLAVLLAQYFKISVIDFDPSFVVLNCLTQIEDVPLTLKNFVKGDAEIEDVIYGGLSRVYVVPAGMNLKEFRKEGKLKEFFERISERSDIIMFDIPDGFGEDAVIAISACTSSIVVLRPEVGSLEKSLYVMKVSEKMKNDVIGVVVNGKSENDGVEIEDIENLIGVVLAEIPHDSAVKQAVSVSRPVVFSSPMSSASIALKGASERIAEWLRSFGKRERDKRDMAAKKRLLDIFVT